MTKFVYEAVCLACGQTTPNDVGFLREQRTPCASCGSIERRYPLLCKSYNGPVGGVMTFKGEKIRPGRRQLDETVGASWSHALNRWVWRDVEVDRRRDLYREIVLDPETGEVLYFCEEPLSAHKDRGTAKPKA